MVLILVLSFVFAGVSKTERTREPAQAKESVVMFVVDMSDSSIPSKDNMNQYMNDLMESVKKVNKEAEIADTRFGLVVFGGEGEKNNGLVKYFNSADDKDKLNNKDAILPGELNDMKFVKDGEDKEKINFVDFLTPYLKKDDETRSQSNIGAGLEKAYDILGSKDYQSYNKKVVLLSDGRETFGDATEARTRLLNAGVSLDCQLFDFVNDGSTQREVQVISFNIINGRVREGEDVEAEVIIKATSSVLNASINLSDIAGRPIGTAHSIDIDKGTTRHIVKFKPARYVTDLTPDDLDPETDGDLKGQNKVEATGVQAVKVDVSLPNGTDLLPANNSHYSWYTFETQGKILIVYGDGTQLEQIESVGDKIDLSNYIVERVSVGNFPRSLEKMLEYDEMVFMNVDYSKLTDNPEQAIANIKRYVEEVGRGILVTLGNNCYDEDASRHCQNCDKDFKTVTLMDKDYCPDCSKPLEQKGGFVESPMNDLFPVKLHLDEEKETIGMVLVVDLSSSMKDQVSNSGSICKKCDFYYEPDTVPQSNVCTNCNQLSTFPAPTRYHIVLESVKKVVKESTFETHDYMGVIVFDQDYHVALEIQEIGDEENREVLCEAMAKEFEKYYYAHYVDKLTGEESDIRINFQEDGQVGYGNKYVDGEDAKYALPENFSEITGGNDKANGDLIKTYGTSYKWPVQEASAMLARAQQLAGSLEIKQVVFMSDGAPNDKGSGYEGIVERMAKGGTVTSSIAIGIDKNNHDAISELEKISVAGKGELFVVNKMSDLKDDLAGIVESTQGELLNKEVNVIPIRDSMNSTVHEGMYDVEYDIIHGYYGSQIKEGAERVIYVDNLRPLYAEWDYGLGKVCMFMSDLGNKNWTGEMFDDTDGKANTLLIKNMLVAPIRNRIDSTGLKYEVSRDNENVTILVETYADIALRDYTDAKGTLFKETINAVIYKFDKKLGIWKEYMTVPAASQIADRKYQINIRTDSIEDAYVVVLELCKAYRGMQLNNGSYTYPSINFSTHGDDPVCDRTTLVVTGTTMAEYNVLNNNNSDGRDKLIELSGGRLLDLEDSGSNSGSSLGNDSAFDSFSKVIKQRKPIKIRTESLDVPLVILALILFILDLIFRNFVIKKKPKVKRQMTDEEQIASMRGR